MALTVSVDEIVHGSRNPLLGARAHWKRVRLGEVASVLNGFAFKSAQFTRGDGMPLIRIRDVGSDSTDTNYVGEFDDRYIVEPGDLLIGMDGDFNCARWRGPRGLLNQRVCKVAIYSNQYHTRFLDFALPGYLKAINDATSSVTVKHLSSRTVEDIPLPFPPLHEQEEIVAELEKQFSRHDEAVANLKRVKANLRNLRASTLNAACEGPWPSIEFGSLARETLVGLDRGRDQQRSVGPGHRYVKMNNVSMDGEIQPEGIVYVDASSQEATRYALRSGDILFNTRNSVELVGKSALVPPALEGALYNNNLMRIRTTPEIDSAFLAMQMCAPVFRRQLARVKRATTSVAAIYLKDLVRVPVIVPPVPEQCRIVAEVERRLSIIREVAAEADRNSQRAQALRHAVLRRAFAGEPEVQIAA